MKCKCSYNRSSEDFAEAISRSEDVNEAGILADAASESEACEERRADSFSTPVCISTNQVFDACRERSCVTDQRVYFSESGQDVIDNAINVKIKKAEIIWVYTDVEPVVYNSGYYSVDVKYFIDVMIDAFCSVSEPTEIHGLVTYDKRSILFGGVGKTKTFESSLNDEECLPESCGKCDMPKAIVETVDPVVLSARLVDDTCCNASDDFVAIPKSVCSCYPGELVIGDKMKKVLVSFGLFTMIRIERNVQLLIDAIDFCIPNKTCESATAEDPCDLFNEIRFPIDEFFPVAKANDFSSASCDSNGSENGCGCGCRR